MQYPFSITNAELGAWLNETQDRQELENMGLIDCCEEESVAEMLAGLGMSETDADVQAFIATLGLTATGYDGKSELTYTVANAETIGAVDDFCNSYTNHYDKAPMTVDVTKLPIHLRDYYGDHIDYNSSYVTILTWALGTYMDAHDA